MRLATIGIDDNTDGVNDCPKIMIDEDVADGPVYVQGVAVTDPEVIAQSRPGAGEVLCVVPRQAFIRAAARIMVE